MNCQGCKELLKRPLGTYTCPDCGTIVAVRKEIKAEPRFTT